MCVRKDSLTVTWNLQLNADLEWEVTSGFLGKNIVSEIVAGEKLLGLSNQLSFILYKQESVGVDE